MKPNPTCFELFLCIFLVPYWACKALIKRGYKKLFGKDDVNG